MKTDKQSPQILNDFLAYLYTVKGKSQKTAHEYYLDLRMFFRFIKHSGIIIISGIIIERCDEVMKAMEENGYKRIELKESSGWAAAAFTNLN